MTGFQYQGSELDLFQYARNWKRYFADRLRPFIAGRVLEVGAGIGATASVLMENAPLTSWTCLEPDSTLCERLKHVMTSERPAATCRIVCGTLDDLDPSERFDTVLYVDVLEHIDDDRAELARSAGRLHSGGRLLVLAPAHQWLFSPFDRAIGHHRRYTRGTLVRAAPFSLRLVTAFYLDSAGLVASLVNRYVLRADYPTRSQVRLWDSVLVPTSRVLDPIARYRLGKSVVGVWTRND
jgi:SAM-dependent methyltransferase